MTTNSAGPLADTAAYAAAVEEAERAAAAYYTAGESTLDDDAYDRLVRAIAAYEEEHPQEVLDASPTGKVAGGAVSGDVPHTVPMLSLDNVFSAEQFVTWTASVERRIGRPVAAWSVEPKLDGLAVAARYRQGVLEQLITRGDGTAGEDVSHAIGTVLGLPERLGAPATLEIRGEILMTTEQFEAANAVRTEHGAAPFANPRNGAAGTLRAKDRPYRVEMTFFAYGALALPDSGELTDTLAGLPHSEVLEYVAGIGVHTAADTTVAPRTVTTVEEVQAGVEDIAALRASLPFGIDGIVIKADLAADQRDAGSGTRAPRWAIAYKLPAVEKVTRLLGVEWNVGRTGIIAPRAVLEPVEIDGSTVSYATLHNPADITRRDLRLGDHVMVYKAGDIIPRIEAPVAHLRTGRNSRSSSPRPVPGAVRRSTRASSAGAAPGAATAAWSPPSPTRRAVTSWTSKGSAPPGSSSSSTPVSSRTSPISSRWSATSCSPWTGWGRPRRTTCWRPSGPPRAVRCPASSVRSACAARAAPCPGGSPATSPRWTGSPPPTWRRCNRSTASARRRPRRSSGNCRSSRR